MSVLQFDEGMARGVERIYKTPDIVAQRSQVIPMLGLREGERVLDLGSGPGLLAFDLAQLVGPEGRAVGIDASEPMTALARERCADLTQARFEVGDVTAMPFADAEFDAAVSTQVYEYVSDMPAALREAKRVLRPGGRLLILDTDWDSLVWNTTDRPRMRRVLQAWDAHLHDAHLPAHLGPLLRDAGFRIQRREVLPLFNPEYTTYSFSAGIMSAIQLFVAGREEIGAELAQAWADELRERAAHGEYFFSINRYVFVATRGD